MMWWDGGYGMGAGGVLWLIVMIAVLVLIVVGIVLLVRGLTGTRDRQEDGRGLVGPGSTGETGTGQGPTRTTTEAALRVLEERYARGEVDREEFLQKKADLQS
jgi:putative membrane protein